MMISSRVTVLLCIMFFSMPLLAVIETYEFSSLELEKRYRRLSQELRCPKCQNQNIADSNAPISQDLRRLLHEQLEAGLSDKAILKDMVGRYGQFVRYRPDTEGATLWLWLFPGLLLGLGAVLVMFLVRRSAAPSATLSDAERDRLATLLNDQDLPS